MKAWSARTLYRACLDLHWLVLRVLGLWRRGAPTPTPGTKTILLTGTFYSANWILNHLEPLVASVNCSRVLLVSTFDLAPIPNVELISPPVWLVRSIGAVPARLLYFTRTAIQRRPDFVGAFHLLPNGLLAVLVARLIGKKSIYFCGGGPREVEGGGYYSGARSFALLKAPDDGLERRLIRVVDQVDLIVTMGDRARAFFRDHGVRSRIEVVPGGVDADRFAAVEHAKSYDLILVGRLHPVKRIDLFLQVVALLAKSKPDVSAVIVGGGNLEGSLRELAARLNVAGRVTFAGSQRDVVPWLAQSKVFVLTSVSEGLSLALMEAMAAGLPAVVANVGELGELVKHGASGFLVDDPSPQAYCTLIEQLLESGALRAQMSAASRRTASGFTTREAAKRWDRILVEA